MQNTPECNEEPDRFSLAQGRSARWFDWVYCIRCSSVKTVMQGERTDWLGCCVTIKKDFTGATVAIRINCGCFGWIEYEVHLCDIVIIED